MDEEFKSFFKAFILDASRGFSEGDEVLDSKIGGFSFRGGGEDLGEFFFWGISDFFSGGEVKEYGEEGFGVDVEMGMSFREEREEVIEDLSFSLRDIMFNGFNLACKYFDVVREGGFLEEFRVFEGEEGNSFGVFFIGFRGRGVIDEGVKPVDSFWVDDEGGEVVREEEVSKRDVESARGFHSDDAGIKMVDDIKERGEAFRGLREGTLFNDVSLRIKDAKVKGIFRHIGADVEFFVPHTNPPFWLGLLSPTNLLWFEGQRDRLPSGLGSPGKMESLSLPSLFAKLFVANFNFTMANKTIT